MNRSLLEFVIGFLAVFVTGNLIHADEPRPNILVVLSDDQSAPHVGCFGDPNVRTPKLDRFASEGMIFTRAYVASPQCVPSRASIFTGRSPVRVGMSRFSAALPAEVKTFPEYLREQGYYVGVAGRTYHMDGSGSAGETIRDIHEKHGLRTFAGRLDYAKQAGGIPQTLNQFSEFLDQVPKEKPFYLQLCFSDPHRPYDGKNIPDPRDPDKLVLPSWMPDTPAVRRDLADYYDEINRLDESFGKVLAELDRRNLKENTFVLFMGDNGAALLRGKGTLYEYGIHVPLIVRWPGKTAPGSKCDELISGEDIGPTALAVAGLPTPDDWTGRSFLPLLLAEADAPVRSYVFAERGPHGSGLPQSTAPFDLGRVIVGKRYKLIYNALWQLPYHPVDFAGLPVWKETQEAAKNGKVPSALVPLYTGEKRAMFELYDLQEDPDELENLSGKPRIADIERKLKETLCEWMILERDVIPLPVPPTPKKANKP